MNQKLSILVLACLIGLSFSQFRSRILQNTTNADAVTAVAEDVNKTNPALFDNATSIAGSIYNVNNGTVNQTLLYNDILVTPNGNGTNTVTIVNANSSLVFNNVSDQTIIAIQQAYSNLTQNVNTSEIADQIQKEVNNGTVNSQEALVIALAAISSTSGNWSNETKEAVDQAVNNITDYLNSLNNSAGNYSGNATQGLESVWANLTNGTNSTLSGFWSNLTTSIENSATTAINNSITGAINSATNAASNAASNAVSSVTNSASNAASNAVSSLFGGGR